MKGQYTTISLDRAGGFATLTLSRPPLNVMNIEMMREMNAALGGLAAFHEKGDPGLIRSSGAT